jgi:serine/threonine/tyrosine protein kinase RAD53
VLECLLDRGAEIEATDRYGWTALTTAAQSGGREVIECLLDRGADVEARGGSGFTALIAEHSW